MAAKMSSIMALFLLGCLIAISSYGATAQADVDSPAPAPAPETSTGVYIVFTEKPPENVEPESFYIRTLSSVFVSEEAAERALIFVYENAVFGFPAMLTPDQASRLQREPGVLLVIPDEQLELLNPRTGAFNVRFCYKIYA